MEQLEKNVLEVSQSLSRYCFWRVSNERETKLFEFNSSISEELIELDIMNRAQIFAFCDLEVDIQSIKKLINYGMKLLDERRRIWEEDKKRILEHLQKGGSRHNSFFVEEDVQVVGHPAQM